MWIDNQYFVKETEGRFTTVDVVAHYDELKQCRQKQVLRRQSRARQSDVQGHFLTLQIAFERSRGPHLRQVHFNDNCSVRKIPHQNTSTRRPSLTYVKHGRTDSQIGSTSLEKRVLWCAEYERGRQNEVHHACASDIFEPAVGCLL